MQVTKTGSGARFLRPGALFAIVLCTAWLAVASAAQAECTSPGFNPSGNFCNGCRYEGSMSMARGQICERVYHPAPQSRDLIQFLSNRVVQRAKHGIAGANANSFAYSPARDFVGQDDFTVEVTYRQGQETGNSLCTGISWCSRRNTLP